jgi:acetyl/propionyl-CoA carboxylase alpha subunit
MLIANRGEIACRIAATCRRLNLRSIAVYSDADAGAPHVKAADEAHYLGASPASASYLNQAALLRVIAETHAEAVHPGYGFLSENAEFAAAVKQAGATFVGPSALVLEQLSDKVRARDLAARVGLSPIPGSSGSVSADEIDGLLEVANGIGWPLLVKAAAGGGGIGMHRALDASELRSAITMAIGAAERAFSDGRVYIERLLVCPRHVEIQVVRDRSGSVRVLGNRECSVQRRYQKLVEESPSPALGAIAPERLSELESSARRLFESVDYVGIGTVELLLDGSGAYYFLEVNARLQVEHTVTELVYGVDLVEEQLRIASGYALSDELFGATARGHAIEARVYAEDPARGFMPQPGQVQELRFPSDSAIRVDCGIEAGSVVSPYYDPLIAKLTAFGQTRAEATQRLEQALSESRLRVVSRSGVRANNLGLLAKILGSPAWKSGKYDTGLVERLVAES